LDDPPRPSSSSASRSATTTERALISCSARSERDVARQLFGWKDRRGVTEAPMGALATPSKNARQVREEFSTNHILGETAPIQRVSRPSPLQRPKAPPRGDSRSSQSSLVLRVLLASAISTDSFFPRGARDSIGYLDSRLAHRAPGDHLSIEWALSLTEAEFKSRREGCGKPRIKNNPSRRNRGSTLYFHSSLAFSGAFPPRRALNLPSAEPQIE
jgi:hypothetical protein